MSGWGGHFVGLIKLAAPRVPRAHVGRARGGATRIELTATQKHRTAL